MKNASDNLFAKTLVLVLCLSLVFPMPVRVHANDRAGTPTVVHGGADFARDGDNLTVTTATNRTIISWDKFGVPGGSTTHFAQPGAGAATLNRVTGALPTHINGVLSSNGAVYVTNAQGVVVGAGGVVQTDGGFVASTMDVSNQDFINGATGSMRFSSSDALGDGLVANFGRIESARGDVFLLGRRVVNTGSVSAPRGTAGFGAGEEVLIYPAGTASGRMAVVATERSFAGGTGVDNSGVVNAASAELRAHGDHYKLAVNNTGIIEARGVERTADGRVFLTATGRGGAASGSVVNAGSVRALKADGSGGDAYVTGGEVTLASGSMVDVSAESGAGGTALIGGEFQGGKNFSEEAAGRERLANAEALTVEEGAQVLADGAGSGDGGLAVLWSDGHTEYTGHVSARGGEAGGDGGFIEVSGKRTLDFAGTVNALGGTGGATGTLLLDPNSYTINAAAAGKIVTALGGANVVVSTAVDNEDYGSDDDSSGNIVVDSQIVWYTNHSLTLLAYNNIHIKADIRNFNSDGAHASTGNLTLVAGWKESAALVDGLLAFTGVVPASLAAMMDKSDDDYADWFGNTGDERAAITVGGTAYTGSIILDASNRGVNVGSRNGETLLFGNDIALLAGGSDGHYAHIGYRTANAPTGAKQTASGDIGVYAKGGLTLKGGSAYNAYAQIGHGGGQYVAIDAIGSAGFVLDASGASLTARVGGDVVIAGGSGNNSYAHLGHGGAALSFAGGATSSVTASDSAITVEAGGGLSLSGGSSAVEDAYLYNSYAHLGHGGAALSFAGGATSSVTASDSAITVEAGGGLSLSGGSSAVEDAYLYNSYAHLGHGGASTSDIPPATTSVFAVGSALTVKTGGGLSLSGGSSAVEDAYLYNSYAHLGHGGAAYASRGAATTSVTAKGSSLTVEAGGGLSLSGGSSSEANARLSNAYAHLGHGGAAYTDGGADTNSKLTVDASSDESGNSSSISVLLLGDAKTSNVSLTGGSANWASNVYAHLGHGGAASVDVGGAATTSVTSNGSSLTVEAGGGLSLSGGSSAVEGATIRNAYAHLGHGGAAYGRSAELTVEACSDESGKSSSISVLLGESPTSEFALALTSGSAKQVYNAYAHLGHGGAAFTVPGYDNPTTMSVTANGSSLTVEAGGGLSLSSGSSSEANARLYNAYAHLGHGGAAFAQFGTPVNWKGDNTGMDMSVVAKSVTLTDNDVSPGCHSLIGMGIYLNLMIEKGWRYPAADGDLTIRVTDADGQVAATGTNAAVLQSGTGSLSLVADGNLNLTSTAFLRRVDHIGETNFVAGGNLTLGTFASGGAINLLAGWKEEAGWTDADAETNAPASLDIGAAMAASADIDQGKKLTLNGALAAAGNLHARAGEIAANGAITNDAGDFGLFRAEKSMAWGTGSSYSSGKAGHRLVLDLTKADAENDPANAFANNAGEDVFDLTDDSRWLIWAETDLGVALNGLAKANRQFETEAPVRTHSASTGWSLEDLAAVITDFAGSGFVFTDEAPTITVTADDSSMTYGDEVVMDWGYTPDTDGFTGMILGDTLDEVNRSLDFSGIADGKTTNAASDSIATSAGGDYYTRISGATSSLGYGFAYVDGVMAIAQRAVTVTASGSSTYGETPNVITVTANDLVNGDTITGRAPSGITAATTAGFYDITLADFTLINADSYEVTIEGTYDVGKRAVTVTASGSSTYGETPNAITVTANDLVNEDTIAGRAPSGITAATAAGSYDITLADFVLTNADSYDFAFDGTGKYEIEKRTVTVSASRVYGDGNDTAAYDFGGMDLAAHDTVADFEGSLGFGDINEYSDAKDYTISLGDLRNDNYVITNDAGMVTFTIAQRAVVITADEASRMVGQANPDFTYTITGTMAFDHELVDIALSTLADAGSPVGKYDIDIAYSLAGGDLNNYDIILVGADRLTVTAQPSSGGNDIAPQLPGSGTDESGFGTGSSGGAGSGTSGGQPSLVGDLGDSITNPDGFGDIVNTDNINQLQPPNGADNPSSPGGGTTGTGSGSDGVGSSSGIGVDSSSGLGGGTTGTDSGSGAGSSSGGGAGGSSGLGGGTTGTDSGSDGVGSSSTGGADSSSGLGGGSPGTDSGSGSGSSSGGGAGGSSGLGGGSTVPGSESGTGSVPPATDGGSGLDGGSGNIVVSLGDSGLSIVFVPSAPSGGDSGEGSDIGSSGDGDVSDWFFSSSTLLTRGQWQALVGIEDAEAFADRVNALWRGADVHPDDESATALGLTLDEVVRLYLPLLARHAPAGYEFDAEVVPLDDEEGEWGVRLTLRRKA